MQSAPEKSMLKKNVSGGKGHRKRASKEVPAHRKNRTVTEAFVSDVMDKIPTTGVTLARVVKIMGGGRMNILTVAGNTIIAGLKGGLRCRKGGATRADNPIAAMVGTYVLLQEEDYGYQIVGVLNRLQVGLIAADFEKTAPKNFFNEGAEEDAGFDWDVEEDVDIDKI